MKNFFWLVVVLLCTRVVLTGSFPTPVLKYSPDTVRIGVEEVQVFEVIPAPPEARIKYEQLIRDVLAVEGQPGTPLGRKPIARIVRVDKDLLGLNLGVLADGTLVVIPSGIYIGDPMESKLDVYEKRKGDSKVLFGTVGENPRWCHSKEKDDAQVVCSGLLGYQ